MHENSLKHAAKACRICGNTEGHSWYEAKEMMFGTGDNFDYFQCGQCECLQIAEVPGDLSSYYPEDYYSLKIYDGDKFMGLKGGFRRFFLRAAVLRKNAWQKFIAYFFPAPQFKVFQDLNLRCDTRILDVGCGSGYKFLYPLAEIGLKNLLGCDPYISAPIRYPNGLSIVKDEIFDMHGEWDLITFHHSFEHVTNPLENLRKVKSLMAEKAVCVLRIPTVSSYAWTKYRTNWVQLDAPRHFFIHSRKSIEYLAHQAGLRLFSVRYDSTHFQFSASEGYLKNIPLVRQRERKRSLFVFLKRKIQKLTFVRKARTLNRQHAGDQAAFFLSH